MTKAAFEQRLAIGRTSAMPILLEILEHARDILGKRLEVARGIEGLTSPAFASSRNDLRGQLDHLVARDFLRTTPRSRLADLPRYLDGMLYRIGNLHGRVERDLAGIEKVAVWERRSAVLSEASEVGHGAAAELRFLVQEYRIATFSQHLGTREKVSAKRLQVRFEALEDLE